MSHFKPWYSKMAAFIYRVMTAAVDQRSRDREAYCQHLTLRPAGEDGNASTPARIFAGSM
jgi:hypothetical protein